MLRYVNRCPCSQAVVWGPAQAIYADSIATGERSRYYTIDFMIYNVGSIAGPLITIIIFAVHHNQWTLLSLRNVFLAGLAVEILSAICLLLFRDDCTLEEESESLPQSSVTSTEVSPVETAGQDSNESATAAKTADADDRSRFVWAIPYITFASSLCFALGSGMTVKVSTVSTTYSRVAHSSELREQFYAFVRSSSRFSSKTIVVSRRLASKWCTSACR